MKNILKNKKKLFIIGGAALALIALIILLIIFIPGKDTPVEVPPVDSEVTETEPVIEIPDETDEEDETGEAEEAEIKEGENVLMLNENIEDNENKSATGQAAAPTAVSQTEAPAPSCSNASGNEGISIGGGEAEAYKCGVANHHCDGPETHAFITNLELEGCPYCGSHSCSSFYATDQWGNTSYSPTKCPKYDINKDPVYYCQTCGKACGDGSKGTCVQFVNPANCPLCGVHVEAWTCHTCSK